MILNIIPLILAIVMVTTETSPIETLEPNAEEPMPLASMVAMSATLNVITVIALAFVSYQMAQKNQYTSVGFGCEFFGLSPIIVASVLTGEGLFKVVVDKGSKYIMQLETVVIFDFLAGGLVIPIVCYMIYRICARRCGKESDERILLEGDYE